MRIADKILKFCLPVILPVLILGGAFCSAGFAALRADSTWRDMEYIRQTDAWLTSRNAAGLKFLPVKSLSEARVSANKSNGSFVNYYQSDNSYTLGAQAESFYQLNSKLVFSGKVAYDNFEGRNMGGSAFIDPYENPLDIVEYPDSNRGTKKMERYFLSGAVSARINKRLALGGKINYLAANYAKMKDLRHTNSLLDMDVSAGVVYTISPAAELGVNYDYRRRVESVAFSSYGNTERQYTSLISFGSFLGRKELFTDQAAYTSENTPMVNNAHEAALQLNIQLNERVKFFNEFTGSVRKGYFGKRGTTSVVHTEHKADTYGYRGVVSFRGDLSVHHLELNAGYQTLLNMENIPRPETIPGSIRPVVYYGQNERLDAGMLNAAVGYTANLRVSGEIPVWILKAGLNYNSRDQTVSFYSFYRKQTINSYYGNLFAKRNIIHDKNMFGISVNAIFGSGNGTAKNDGVYANSSENQNLPATDDLYLYREYEYLTSSRVRGEVGFRYSRLQTKKGIIPYIQANYAYTRAFKVTYLGNDFNDVNLTIGCTF